MKSENFLTNMQPMGMAKTFAKKGDIMFAIAILGILLVMLFPVPTWLIDFLLGISFTLSILILMTCLFISRPLELSAFPTILLMATMMRLSLNIASTRLILSYGHTGTDAAGHVIEAFGNFVMGGNLVIGAIVFAILTIINFIVITKGSGRIAEVAARFSLDAMPGKQMAIDADLSAGLIDEATAKKRRKDLEDESTFFGSMDGANKFVRGDVIAGLLIIIINFVAGIIIGVVQRNLSVEDALHTYSILTIGDGLVTQIPGLIVSLAAGLLVSKSGIVGTADQAVLGQLKSFPQALWLCCAVTFFMGFMPGIPIVPFFLISSIMGYTAFSMKKTKATEALAIKQEEAKEEIKKNEKPQEEAISEALTIDSIRLELGYGLLPLINYTKGSKLTDQIKNLRKQMVKDLGFIIPAVRIQDNLQLEANSYCVKIKDIECARGTLRPDMLLVMDPKGDEINLPGEKTQEPAFGLPAMWISESLREEALYKNYTVVDPPTVLTTHVTEIIKENITELLSYSETQKLLDEAKENHKKLVEDTVPTQVSISVLQRVLQNLLAENISIRDLPKILEAISEFASTSKNPIVLTEQVRMRLGRQISYSHLGEDGAIAVITLSPEWEQLFIENIAPNPEERGISMPPSKIRDFVNSLRTTLEEMVMKGEAPALLTSPSVRPYARAIIERFRPSQVVLSQNEIYPRVKIRTIGVVR